MATRSEELRARLEREAARAKHPATVEDAREPAEHAEKNATYAREEGVALDQRSRRSSRKSANHARTDAGIMHATQMKQNRPSRTYERSAAAGRGGR